MTEQKREFTGIWIPKTIVEDEDLTWTDRALYAEVSCYEECFMSNAFLAKRISVSESQVGRIISKLKAKGYLEQTAFDGRKRYLKVRQTPHEREGRLRMDADPDSASTLTIDNNLENSLDKAVEIKISPAENSQNHRKEIWEELVKILGYSTKDITKNVRGQLNNATKQLCEVGATREEVAKRSRNYKQVFPNATFTAMGLVNQWALLASPQNKPLPDFDGVLYDNKGRDFEFDENGDAII